MQRYSKLDIISNVTEKEFTTMEIAEPKDFLAQHNLKIIK